MSFKLSCLIANCFFSLLLFSKSNNFPSQGELIAVTKPTNTFAIQNKLLGNDSLKMLNASLKKEIIQKNIKLAKLKNDYLSEKEKTSNTFVLLQFQNKKIYGLILLTAIFFIIIVYLLLLLRSYRLELKKKTNELYYCNETIKITNSNFISSQGQHQLVLEQLVSKERELTALTLQLANIQDSILSIIEKSGQGSKEIKDVKMQNLIKEIRSILSQKEYWSEFMMKFSKIHPEFNINIKEKYPKLTSKDISFCSLIKLNLSNKEIANLLQVSHESVITKKYLLKKKLELQPDEDLFQIVNNIE